MVDKFLQLLSFAKDEIRPFRAPEAPYPRK